MKTRALAGLILLVFVVWMLLINAALHLFNMTSDIAVAAALIIALISIVVIPEIFVLLLRRIAHQYKTHSKCEQETTHAKSSCNISTGHTDAD